MRVLKVIFFGLIIVACEVPEKHSQKQPEAVNKVTDLMLSDSQVLLANIKTKKVASQKQLKQKLYRRVWLPIRNRQLLSAVAWLVE